MEHPLLLSVAVLPYALKDDGTYPNNPTLPVLFYQGCLQLPGQHQAAALETLFKANGWGGAWRNGIYDFHHYHSSSHEVMGVYSGNAQVQLGGPHGVTLGLQPGDVLIIPAGVAHRNLGSSDDFGCVGAYPPGQEQYDVLKGNAGERPAADNNIKQVPLPPSDPVHGENGPLFDYWKEYTEGL